MTAAPQTANLAGLVRDGYGLESYDLPVASFRDGAMRAVFLRAVEILVARAEDRIRRGLYRRYVDKVEDLMFVRDPRRADTGIERLFRQDNYLRCSFNSNQAQLEDNLILLWALVLASRTELEDAALAARVRGACETLAGALPLTDSTGAAVYDRFYGRLETDERPLHGLCRLLIEHVAPENAAGKPVFRLDMSALYRACVTRKLMSLADPYGTANARYSARAVPGGGVRADVMILNACVGKSDLPTLICPVQGEAELDDRLQRELATAAAETGSSEVVIVHPASWRLPVGHAANGVAVREATLDLAQLHAASAATLWAQVARAGNVHRPAPGRPVAEARC